MTLARELAVMAEQCTGRGTRGVAVAAAPQAARVGARVLAGGGNAYDAVVDELNIRMTQLGIPPRRGAKGKDTEQ